jgi:hypothetical protein
LFVPETPGLGLVYNLANFSRIRRLPDHEATRKFKNLRIFLFFVVRQPPDAIQLFIRLFLVPWAVGLPVT